MRAPIGTSEAHGSPAGSIRWTGAMPTPVRRGRPPAHLRHHQPPRRRQDDPHGEVPPLRRRGAVGRRGEGPRRAPAGHVGLDGDGAEARHLDHLDRAAVPLPRPRAQPARHPRPPRLLRGHVSGAGGRRRRDHGARRRQGHRAADAQALRGVPRAGPAAAHLHQQVGPAGPGAPRAARPDRARSCRSCRRRSRGRSASPATSAGWSTGATTATCASPARLGAPPRRGRRCCRTDEAAGARGRRVERRGRRARAARRRARARRRPLPQG